MINIYQVAGKIRSHRDPVFTFVKLFDVREIGRAGFGREDFGVEFSDAALKLLVVGAQHDAAKTARFDRADAFDPNAAVRTKTGIAARRIVCRLTPRPFGARLAVTGKVAGMDDIGRGIFID